MINEKDPNCICYGNWQSIVKENQDNLDKIYIDEDGKEFIFFGIVYGSDDYYYGLHERGTIGKLRLVSCVMNIESAGFTLKENKMKNGIDVDKMLNLDEETVKIPSEEALEMFPNAKNFFYGFNVAKKHGLEYEFVEWFLRNLSATDYDIRNAVEIALYEWDL